MKLRKQFSSTNREYDTDSFVDQFSELNFELFLHPLWDRIQQRSIPKVRSRMLYDTTEKYTNEEISKLLF